MQFKNLFRTISLRHLVCAASLGMLVFTGCADGHGGGVAYVAQPAVVVVAPQPVYVEPRPQVVYVAPQPVYVAPRPVYVVQSHGYYRH